MGKVTYTVILERNKEGGYTVTVPALKGCITQGETVAQS
jgi:predicted RNase H-like HicB family nuclease